MTAAGCGTLPQMSVRVSRRPLRWPSVLPMPRVSFDALCLERGRFLVSMLTLELFRRQPIQGGFRKGSGGAWEDHYCSTVKKKRRRENKLEELDNCKLFFTPRSTILPASLSHYKPYYPILLPKFPSISPTPIPYHFPFLPFLPTSETAEMRMLFRDETRVYAWSWDEG